MTERRLEPVDEFHRGPEEMLRNLAQRVNQILRGQGNNHYRVTLVPNATVTEVIATDAVADSQAPFHPESASAATAIAAGVVWTECTMGKVLIHHDSQPDTDRQIGLRVHG
jgi:hypothetical protein